MFAPNISGVYESSTRRTNATQRRSRLQCVLAALVLAAGLALFASDRADAAYNTYFCGTGSSNHCNALSGVWDGGFTANNYAFINAYRGSSTTSHCGADCGIYIEFNDGPGTPIRGNAGISWGTSGISATVEWGSKRSRTFCDVANASLFPWATCYKNRD